MIACGGGAVLDADNRRALRAAGVVVWLAGVARRRSASRLARRRLAPAARRRRHDRDARAARRRCAQPAYEAAAHVTVDTEGRTVDEVAAAVIEEFHAWNG